MGTSTNIGSPAHSIALNISQNVDETVEASFTDHPELSATEGMYQVPSAAVTWGLVKNRVHALEQHHMPASDR